MHVHPRHFGRLLLLAALALAALAVPAAAQSAATEPAQTEPVARTTVDVPTVTAPTAHPWIKPAPPSGANDNDWQGNVALYGFLSSINGELRARDQVVEVDRSFGDIADVLKFAAGVRIEAHHGPWG